MKLTLTTTLALALSGAVNAATLYSDAAAFEAAFASVTDATGGITSATTQAEIDALAVGGLASAGIPGAGIPPDFELLSGMIFTDPPAGSFGPQAHGFYDSVDLSDVFDSTFAYQLYNPVSESHAIEFASGIGSFGFSIFDAGDGRCFVGCAASSFTIEAFDMSGGSLGASVVAPGLGGVGFFGIGGEGVLIGRVSVLETLGYYDNEYFGDYVTGSVAPVPLPAGAPLLIGGLVVLAGLRRRKRA